MSAGVVVSSGIQSDKVRFDAEHVLFVEGQADSIDANVLSILFDRRISVRPLGHSFSVKSVAEALFPHHPTYYFLVDRDHYDDAFVNQCWSNFPNPATHNLLVWKRREIENYFLEPTFLAKSEYLQPGITEARLTQCIVLAAQKRLFLDVANAVVVHVREELKKTWIETFTNPDKFNSKERAIEVLQAAAELSDYKKKVSRLFSTKGIERLFTEYLGRMTGGEEHLSFGTGDWLKRIQGKAVLNQVISSGSFKVTDKRGNPLNGVDKLNEVVKGLLREEEHLPEDFKELKRLILARGNS